MTTACGKSIAAMLAFFVALRKGRELALSRPVNLSETAGAGVVTHRRSQTVKAG
jgi:hypothetical protein